MGPGFWAKPFPSFRRTFYYTTTIHFYSSSPPNHSSSSYTYSSQSHLFGVYLFLVIHTRRARIRCLATTFVFVVRPCPRHIICAFSLSLHQRRSLFCKLCCRFPLNSASDPSILSPSHNCPATAWLFSYLRCAFSFGSNLYQHFHQFFIHSAAFAFCTPHTLGNSQQRP